MVIGKVLRNGVVLPESVGGSSLTEAVHVEKRSVANERLGSGAQLKYRHCFPMGDDVPRWKASGLQDIRLAGAAVMPQELEMRGEVD